MTTFGLREYGKCPERHQYHMTQNGSHVIDKVALYHPQYDLNPPIIQQLYSDIQTFLTRGNYRGNHNDQWRLLTKNELKVIEPRSCLGKDKQESDWKVIMGILYEPADLYKLALWNQNTQQIALITREQTRWPTINPTKTTTIPTQDPNWKIFKSKMMAPLIFWHQLYLITNDTEVERLCRETADPLPLKAGEWQGNPLNNSGDKQLIPLGPTQPHMRFQLLIFCDDDSFMSSKVKVEWEGDTLVDLREKISEKCRVANHSFDLEYLDADFNEYVRLDEDGFKNIRNMMWLKIVERTSNILIR